MHKPLNTRLDAEVRNLDLENLTYDALLKFAKEAQ